MENRELNDRLAAIEGRATAIEDKVAAIEGNMKVLENDVSHIQKNVDEIRADIKVLSENVAKITGMMKSLVGLPEKVEAQGRQISRMQGGAAVIVSLAVAVGIFYKLFF